MTHASGRAASQCGTKYICQDRNLRTDSREPGPKAREQQPKSTWSDETTGLNDGF